MTTDVLLVGAGPVGLVVAHELARRGVRVRLVDAAKGPAVTSRALATHPRSLEVYDQMGVLDDLWPRGRQVTHFTLHSGRHEARMDAASKGAGRLPSSFRSRRTSSNSAAECTKVSNTREICAL